MSPTYTMSAHLCKQIYASWRQTHDHTSPTSTPSSTIVSYDGSHPAAPKDDKLFYRISTSSLPSYKPYQRSSPQKRSMDSDRSSDSE